MTKEYIINKFTNELSSLIGTVESVPIIRQRITWAYEAGFSNATYVRKTTKRVGLYSTDSHELIYRFSSINEASYMTNTPSVRIGVRINNEYKHKAYIHKKPYYFKLLTKLQGD